MRISVTHFKKLGRPEAAKKMDYNKRNETKEYTQEREREEKERKRKG